MRKIKRNIKVYSLEPILCIQLLYRFTNLWFYCSPLFLYIRNVYLDTSQFDIIIDISLDSLREYVLLRRDKTTFPTLWPSQALWSSEPARSEETHREAVRMRRSRSSYPVHEYGRNDRFTDSSHRRLPLRGGFLKRKARLNDPRTYQRAPVCTSNRTSTVYALRLQPFHFLSDPILPLDSLSLSPSTSPSTALPLPSSPIITRFCILTSPTLGKLFLLCKSYLSPCEKEGER